MERKLDRSGQSRCLRRRAHGTGRATNDGWEVYLKHVPGSTILGDSLEGGLADVLGDPLYWDHEDGPGWLKPFVQALDAARER